MEGIIGSIRPYYEAGWLLNKGGPMNYVLAIFLPPLAVLLEGKFFQFFLNCFLCLFFVLPGIIHALAVVHIARTREETDRLIRAINKQGQVQK